ncbi:MAG: response regulator transcription factor [Campylobacteraceae bacterium]|nr:response regulator transcription factor [Campylobacteraceae bacterium]
MNERLKVLENTRVLLVDDDELTRVAISNGLKKHCESFITAVDGLDGLEKFKQDRVDIVITDILMPNLNGFDMMNEILKLKPDQNFIVITSYDSDKNLFKSIEKGAISFMKKPVTMEDLQNTVIMAALKNKTKTLNLTPSITLNFNKERIFKDGKEIYLTKLENSIFWLFCYNLSNLVTYEMIENYAYDGKSVTTGAIHTAILRLKKQLDGINLTNVQSLGYILKPVE